MSKPRNRRGAEEIRAAIRRLNAEHLLPLTDLAREEITVGGQTFKPSVLALRRWSSEGKNGVYLDALFSRRIQAWVSSREAVQRFCRALEARASV